MTDARTCTAVYTVIVRGEPEHYRCQYLPGHPSDRHSFFALQTSDAQTVAFRDSTVLTQVPTFSEQTVAAEMRIRERERSRGAVVPTGLDGLLEQIDRGDLDRCIEVLLSALHDRKRTRRGTPGFRAGRR